MASYIFNAAKFNSSIFRKSEGGVSLESGLWSKYWKRLQIISVFVGPLSPCLDIVDETFVGLWTCGF